MNKVFLKNLIRLIIFQLMVLTAHAQSNLDPVVISLGDTEITRSQFEQAFEMAMVMKALETGVPIKNQDQIQVMEHRFLQQYAKELALVELARQRGIKVSEKELDLVINAYMQDLGFTGYSEKNLRKLGFEDEQQFREILKRKQILSRFVTSIETDLKTDSDQSAVNEILEEYYIQRKVRTFPEKIDRPSLN